MLEQILIGIAVATGALLVGAVYAGVRWGVRHGLREAVRDEVKPVARQVAGVDGKADALIAWSEVRADRLFEACEALDAAELEAYRE